MSLIDVYIVYVDKAINVKKPGARIQRGFHEIFPFEQLTNVREEVEFDTKNSCFSLLFQQLGPRIPPVQVNTFILGPVLLLGSLIIFGSYWQF